MRTRAALLFRLLMLLLLPPLAAACAGTPWFLGEPLDGRPAIPPQSRAGTVAQHRRAYEGAHATGAKLIELQELAALEARDALRRPERARYIALIEERAGDWEALGRSIPLAADLGHLVELVPGRAAELGPRLAAAERGAAERWQAIGETARAERARRRAQEAEAKATAKASAGAGAAPKQDLDKQLKKAPQEQGQAVVLVEPASEDLLLGGPTLARSLLPLGQAFPHLLAPGPRSAGWAERLVAEDPTAPDSLEVAARIDALAGRLDGAGRTLDDMVYFSPDRRTAQARAAAVWEAAGQTRRACVAWARAARAGTPDDPYWCSLYACVKRDPGAGDPEAVARYLRDRAPALACVAPPATPEQPSAPAAPPGGAAGGGPTTAR
jgi:hypothetical protein